MACGVQCGVCVVWYVVYVGCVYVGFDVCVVCGGVCGMCGMWRMWCVCVVGGVWYVGGVVWGGWRVVGGVCPGRTLKSPRGGLLEAGFPTPQSGFCSRGAAAPQGPPEQSGPLSGPH